MAKKPNHAVFNEVQQLQHDIKTLSKEDIESTYGIQIKDDNTIFDPTYDRTFDTLIRWANYELEQDRLGYASEEDYTNW